VERVVLSSVQFVVRSCATLSAGAVRSRLRALHLCISYLFIVIDTVVCANKVMCRLTTGMRSEKGVRGFRRCANVMQCTYTNPDSTV